MKNKQAIVFAIILLVIAVVAFATAMLGVKVLMVLYICVVIAAIIYCLWQLAGIISK